MGREWGRKGREVPGPASTDAPTGAPTNATNTTTSRRLEATVPLPVSKSFHRSGGAHTEARRRLQALSS